MPLILSCTQTNCISVLQVRLSGRRNLLWHPKVFLFFPSKRLSVVMPFLLSVNCGCVNQRLLAWLIEHRSKRSGIVCESLLTMTLSYSSHIWKLLAVPDDMVRKQIISTVLNSKSYQRFLLERRYRDWHAQSSFSKERKSPWAKSEDDHLGTIRQTKRISFDYQEQSISFLRHNIRTWSIYQSPMAAATRPGTAS